jgi:hypothetical protein
MDRTHSTRVRAFEEERDTISTQYGAIQETPDLPTRAVLLDAALVHFRSLVGKWITDVWHRLHRETLRADEPRR